MEGQIILESPPLYITELTPNQIVGYENMQIFVQHLRICKSGTNAGEFPAGRLNKEIGPANRDKIAYILGRLRSCGFYPLGVDENGRVMWGITLKSQSQQEFEKGLSPFQNMTIPQLQEAARAGFRAIRDGLDNEIGDATFEEREFEEAFGR
jgi:hypothetical protein